MSPSAITELAERLLATDAADSAAQREIFERIRDLRTAFDGPFDPESQRCLEAAGMLVAYLARMGALAGNEVREIAVRLLRSAAEAESQSESRKAAPGAGAPGAAAATPPEAPSGPARPVVVFAPGALDKPAAPIPSAPSAPERTATDVMGDMLLGQILLQRGHILEEHIHQAMKVQRSTSLRIGDIFVKIGACSRAQLAEALNHQSALRRVRGAVEVQVVEKDKPDTRGTGLKLVGEAMLGEILIERDVITRRQLERALEVQKQTGTRIGEALVKIGATTLEQIEQALRIQGRDRRFGTKSTSPVTKSETGKGKR